MCCLVQFFSVFLFKYLKGEKSILKELLFVFSSCLVLVWQIFLVQCFQHILQQVCFSIYALNLYLNKDRFLYINLVASKSLYSKMTLLFSKELLWMRHVGSFSRSAVNHESGAKTGLSGILMGIIMCCALLFMTPIFEYIPQVWILVTLSSADTVWLLLFHFLSALECTNDLRLNL